jgi:hypothetical protein
MALDAKGSADSKPEDSPDEDMLQEGLDIFKLCEERESDNRDTWIEDVKFGRLGQEHQWPANIKKARDDKGLPCLTINQMTSLIRGVINDTRQNKPAIAVKPVDSGSDKKTALIYSGLIRSIEQQSNADAAYDTGVECAASGGWGYLRVAIDYTHDDSFDKDIRIHRVADPLMCWGDPFSMSVDSSDWNDAFIAESVPRKQFKKRYPKAEETNFDGAAWANVQAPWLQQETVLVCEWWHRDEVEREIVKLSNGLVFDAEEYEADKEIHDAAGLTEVDRRPSKSYKVVQRFMTGAEIIEENEWPGKFIPLIPVYGDEVVIEGKRVLRSMIADAKDPQRNYNYWRSKASEVAAKETRSQWLVNEDSLNNDYADRWDNPDDHNTLVYTGSVPPQRPQKTGPDAAALQEAASANNDIMQTTGIYNAARGAPSNEQSGRAINARKIETDTGMFHFPDNLTRAIRHLGIVLVDLIPHVYTPGRIIRVLGQDGKENHVQLGEKAPPLPPPAEGDPEMPGMTMGPSGPMPMPPLNAGEDNAPPDYSAIYDLGVGKYDVIVTAGPGYQTRRQEAADQQMQMVQAFPQLGALIGDIIAENQDWPGADEISRRLKKMLPPQLQDHPEGQDIPPQLVQQIEQGKQLIAQLQHALQQCQAELQTAKVGHDLEAQKIANDKLSIAIDQYNAQTSRMEAQWKAGSEMVKAFQTAAAPPKALQATQPQPNQRMIPQ